VDIAVVAAVVGAGLETETETETKMMRGEARADDRLLRDDGTQTVHNIYYTLAASHCVVFCHE
jgi:hypothetical protein